MPVRVLLALLVLVLAGVTGCRSGPRVTWGAAAPPRIPADVVDGRGRFREILCTLRETREPVPDDRPCAEALVRFPDEPPATGAPVATDRSPTQRRVIVVQGLFGQCLSPWVSAYEDGRAHLERLGYRPGLIDVSGTSSSEVNGQKVRDVVMELGGASAEEQVILVGYSKGAVDVLEALIAFPELASRVAAFVSVAGPILGSPLADRMPPWRRTAVEALASPICGGGRGAITSITREERRSVMARQALPGSVPYFSVIGMVDDQDVSRALLPSYRDLALVDPRNDGQVVPEDAVIPRGVLLGYARADHWAIALPFSRTRGPLGWLAHAVADRNAYPRELLLEAIVRAVEERLTGSRTTGARTTRR